MQTDMHYYGTYVLARAAGLNAGVCQTIATAAEYVDDSDYVRLSLTDGPFLEAHATAHHPVNADNLEDVDQRRVWVPFHFLPGNEGNTFDEKLICRKDSPIAQEMVEHHLDLQKNNFSLELIGITAHVYADTFSHYGFSGIASNLNQVDPDSINLNIKEPTFLSSLKEKAIEFNEKYIAGKIASAVGLGHGDVATYPDRPFLQWSFRYQATGISSGDRVNQVTFLEGCQKLHQMFAKFAEAYPELCDQQTKCNFVDIEKALADILSVEAEVDERIEAWQTAVIAGKIYSNPNKEPIPAYNKTFNGDIEIMQTHSFDTIKSTAGYAFLDAAKTHREYVLNELLPKHGLNVLVTS